VSCLPAGVLSDGIAPSKSPNWKKSGMRLTMVLFVSWFNLVLQGIAPCLILFILQHNGYRVFSTPQLFLTYTDIVSVKRVLGLGSGGGQGRGEAGETPP